MLTLSIIGILGNSLALRKQSMDTSKHNFGMLIMCLMANNLIALTGVAIMLTLVSKQTMESYPHLVCGSWVAIRFFGTTSGCIAVFMSVERYLAISHLFIHKVHLTRDFTKIVIVGLTALAAVITFLPFFGFGIYLDEGMKKCAPYRNARTTIDGAYALLFFTFATLICIIIITFNTLVIRALFDNMRRRKNMLASTKCLDIPELPAVEIKFSKLMLMLDLSFIIGWMPHKISVILALVGVLPEGHWFFRLAEDLIILHFVLDPYIYVLRRESLRALWSTMQCRAIC